MHVVKYEVLEHFIVCYAYSEGRFLIGDPSEGISEIKETELSDIWTSKALLTFSVSSTFTSRKNIVRDKYKWIKNAISADRRLVVITIILGVFITLLSFTTTIFTEKLIDNLIPSNAGIRIIIALCSWCVLLFINVGFDYARQNILLMQTLRLNVRLNDNFINSILQKPKFFFDSRKKGDFIARLFDVGRIQSSVAVIIGNDLIKLLTLVVSNIVVCFYNIDVGIFLLLIIPIYSVIIYFSNVKLQEANKAVMLEYARNESSYIDVLSGIEPIIQKLKVSSEAAFLSVNFAKFQKSLQSVGLIEVKFKIQTGLFGILCLFLIVIFCVKSVLSEALELGDMVAILSIAGIALASANQLALSITHLQEAKVALDRTFDIISIPEEIGGRESISKIKSIIFSNVSFRFNGHDELFKNLSFNLETGAFICLIGDNGTGKSTVLQLAQKFLEPNTGIILINNLEFNNLNIKSVRKALGVVPQEIKIFNQSLAYNITLEHNIHVDKLSSFCSDIGISRFINSFHRGLDTILGEDGIKVSGGQRQLIGLARALYSNPDILLLDEFTAAMDTSSKKLALNIISSLRNNIGVIAVTHDEELLKLSTSKVNMNDFSSNKA